METRGADVQQLIEATAARLPFRYEFSLDPLIEFWMKAFGEDASSAKATVAGIVRDKLAKAPELTGRIEDPDVLSRHPQLLDLLMSVVFPPAFFDQEYGAALLPFELRSFYATPAFRRSFMADGGRLRARVNLDEASVALTRLLHAYKLILRRVYDFELDVEYPLVFTTTDPRSGLDRHFKVAFDQRFLDVVPLGAVPPLTDELRTRLRADLLDRDLLLEILPPEKFLIRGFSIFRAVDVTDEEILSSIKRDLIDKESIVSNARFQSLQDKLRTLFRRPELRFGLAAVEGNQVLLLNSSARLEHSCIFADSAHLKTSDFAGSVFARAFLEKRPIIVDDLVKMDPRTPVEEEMVCRGVRSLVVAPLHYQDSVIGTLELESPIPADLDATHLPKLWEILPLFSIAVQRSIEELNDRIDAFIKEQFTAIHPTVEWRFRKAVLTTIERTHGEPTKTQAELEPIVFENVYPLYALADIRGSSIQRARSIQADLLAQLRLARDVVESAHRARALPALDELLYRVDKHRAHIERGLSSGDEVGVITFLRAEVEALFDHLRDFEAGVRDRIEAYRRALDPRRGVVYVERRRFEESVAGLTEAISSYVDLEEQAAQTMFPHYFEKQKTDGVDYQIYIGPSLVEDGRFDPLYLKNLRLWQLMVACGVAGRTAHVRDQLPMPLETTQLVLVQHAPLSIRFRVDEKRFDVDGAYDIRYEIVKKRIDKAVVRGSTERVTQPGKIAIVYSQPAEAQEYRRYVEYLQNLGYLTREVEPLELDELQGVHGLRALRVTVDLANPRVEQRVVLADAQAAPGV
jgi:hypothetical protein